MTFSGAGAAPYSRTYAFESRAFRPVEFEFDSVSNAHPVTSIDTYAHPNRPASLPRETLSLEDVYERAGFAVTKSGGDQQLPLTGAGADSVWSTSEMHDAMQTYWSRFANAPQWALWVFFAALSDQGTSLGGIMFDDIGPNHRQGTAIFTDAFIATAPTGDSHPAEWVSRMRFWTAAHEMGHAFNLAHSWQKAAGTPWIPLANDPEARSFMNYPYNVTNGQAAFFGDFGFRFSDPELLFMRHAPERFVQMGNAEWFDHHGFELPDGMRSDRLRLQIRANREAPVFEFLEPVTLELKLTNTSGRPQVVNPRELAPQNLTVVIKKDGKPARRWAPYSQLCLEEQFVVLQPGESTYAPLRLFAGTNGWDISEPGRYVVQVCLDLGDDIFVSDPLRLKITPPNSRQEETIAADMFTEEVGRTLVFSGTEVLESAKRTLEQVVAELSTSRAAVHAQLALAAPLGIAFKKLEIPDRADQTASVADVGGLVRARAPKVEQATQGLSAALVQDAPTAAETLGNITYRRQVDKLSTMLARNDDAAQAADCQRTMLDVFEARGVLPTVRAQVADAEREYRQAAPAKRPAAKRTSKRKR